MNDGPYALLEIDDDADERTIKRAYARLLKVHRPDDDPEGFQRLNQAYQFCLSQWEGGGPEAPQGFVFHAPAAPATPAPEPVPVVAPSFDIGTFVVALFDLSQTASGRDVLKWLQAHPAFYSIGARETHAYQIVDALLRKPALPPRHVAAVLHFLGLDTAGPSRAQFEPYVVALERYAQMTLEDAEAIRKPYVEPSSPSSSGNLGWSFGVAIWMMLLAMLSVTRCSGAAP
ncbi:MAG: J domain-containing protein [Pseudoxanthomonas sp.]